MNGFAATHVPLLRALGEVWGPDRFIVIGAAAVARHGADATAYMTRAGAGRSTYVSPSNLKGVPDPGAEAVARLLKGLA